MILNYNDFKSYVKTDFRSKGRKFTFVNILKDPVLRFTFLLRYNEFLINTNKSQISRILPYILFRRLSIRLGFSIPFNVIDPGLAIVHYGLLIISPGAKIGRNCRIHAGVNIGGGGGFIKKDEVKNNYAPSIGNNCYIGPGAKIYGIVKIGNNCVIGANAVVNKSFDGDSLTIAGVPAKIIANRGSEGMLINETL